MKAMRGFHTLLFHDVPAAQQENTKRKLDTIKTGNLKAARFMTIHTADGSNQLLLHSLYCLSHRNHVREGLLHC